jgi:hypothetical protein
MTHALAVAAKSIRNAAAKFKKKVTVKSISSVWD